MLTEKETQTALNQAVDYCIENDILKEFLLNLLLCMTSPYPCFLFVNFSLQIKPLIGALTHSCVIILLNKVNLSYPMK